MLSTPTAEYIYIYIYIYVYIYIHTHAYIHKIHLPILPKFHQLINLNRKGKYQVSEKFHIKFPSNLFVDKI